MNDTVTILGRVGADPNRSETPGGVPVVNFRVASPQRRYDSKTQSWLETNTNWYNVSAFRQLAEHTKASLHSGDAVIVTGKLKLREWESGGKKGMSADIDADAIGHDLRWGASAFVKASRPGVPQQSVDDVQHSSSPDENIDDDGIDSSAADTSAWAEVS
ncbi:MAG TPA: single-stranded DNA-binding protein [Microbacterium sp.]|uniref:single-stranded DNA-binding protein n=1 Tax=Microbacterium sp. TaxID=51671 RepID=UPI000EEA1336|nr:single-stranded DNA-binding protein [Microbacterium sp.]